MESESLYLLDNVDLSVPENDVFLHRRLKLIALGLVLFAKKQSNFKKLIFNGLFDRNFYLPNTEVHLSADDITLIKWIPQINPLIAEKQLIWLFNEMEYVQLPEREKLITILHLAFDKPTPQAAAWGIIFNETLGVFVAGHPFDIKSSIDYSQVVIVDSNWKQFKPHILAKRINKASIKVLTKCMESANYDLKRLEPEVSSWLWEGSEIKLYYAKRNGDFEDILNCAHKSGLLCFVTTEDINVLALQPCITGSYDCTLLAPLIRLE
jgi:hypothetical protein